VVLTCQPRSHWLLRVAKSGAKGLPGVLSSNQKLENQAGEKLQVESGAWPKISRRFSLRHRKRNNLAALIRGNPLRLSAEAFRYVVFNDFGHGTLPLPTTVTANVITKSELAQNRPANRTVSYPHDNSPCIHSSEQLIRHRVGFVISVSRCNVGVNFLSKNCQYELQEFWSSDFLSQLQSLHQWMQSESGCGLEDGQSESKDEGFNQSFAVSPPSLRGVDGSAIPIGACEKQVCG
jgi:hypothetical protein